MSWRYVNDVCVTFWISSDSLRCSKRNVKKHECPIYTYIYIYICIFLFRHSRVSTYTPTSVARQRAGEKPRGNGSRRFSAIAVPPPSPTPQLRPASQEVAVEGRHGPKAVQSIAALATQAVQRVLSGIYMHDPLIL